MTSQKHMLPHNGGKKLSKKTVNMLSRQQEDYQKFEQEHFSAEDKGQVARRERANGSTLYGRS